MPNLKGIEAFLALPEIKGMLLGVRLPWMDTHSAKNALRETRGKLLRLDDITPLETKRLAAIEALMAENGIG